MNNLRAAVQRLAWRDFFRNLEAIRDGLLGLAEEFRLEDEGVSAADKFTLGMTPLLEQISGQKWEADHEANKHVCVAEVLEAMSVAEIELRLARESIYQELAILYHDRPDEFKDARMHDVYASAYYDVLRVAERLGNAISILFDELAGESTAEHS